MPTVDEGIQSQLRNIEKDYGRTIDELVLVVTESKLTNHNDVVAMLKQRYGMAHGAAHRVSLVARGRAAQPAPAGAGLAPPLKDVYTRLLKKAVSLGSDVEQAPKKGYVSLRRRKQFAMLQPGARWVNLGLVLAQQPPSGRLESAAKWNALFTHRVRVAASTDIDDELESWLRKAYDAAG
jgi:hypothetical protein